jgi:serine phosphatase RsbU (regulator of sigma subunit)
VPAGARATNPVARSPVRSAIVYDAAGVFVLNRSVPLLPGAQTMVVAGMASVGFDLNPPSGDPMLRSGKGIVGHVIFTGETVIAPDVREDPRYVAGRSTTRSEIAVPIVSNGRVIGALNLESDRLAVFSGADAHLLDLFATAAAISIEKAFLHRQLLEKERIEHQLVIAREVQANLLPTISQPMAGWDVAAANLPTWDIGGDYYDYIPLADGRVALVIADVAGKGIPAALIMASFRAALRTDLHKGSGIDEVIADLNRLIVETGGVSRYVTAVCGVFDPAEGRLTYVNCGHNPPLVLRSTGTRETLSAGGTALGIFDRCTFDSDTVTLGPSDALALYTDGVVEVTDSNDVEFGMDGLDRTLRQSSAEPAARMVRSVIDATQAFSGSETYTDDFTLVVIKRAQG